VAKTATIRQVHFIPAPPKKVYEAYLDAKKHAMFTGSKAAIDAKVGGQILCVGWQHYRQEPGARAREKNSARVAD
jgi:uncharacterized protein YndB with AHSA1/START domain